MGRCADAASVGNTYIQVCRYAVPGNCNMAAYDTWLEPMLLSSSPCRATCHPDDCGGSNGEEVEPTPPAPLPTPPRRPDYADTNNGAVDEYGNRCADYNGNERWCSKYDVTTPGEGSWGDVFDSCSICCCHCRHSTWNTNQTHYPNSPHPEL